MCFQDKLLNCSLFYLFNLYIFQIHTSQMKDAREEVYRWKILITWQISAPKLDHYVTVVKRCHHNASCVAAARYSTVKLAVSPSLDKVMTAEST